MTPFQMAKQECANLNDNGTCMGMEFDDGLRPVRCVPRPKCLLVERGVRCRYFEECVVPMHTDPKWGSLRLAEWADGLREYRVTTDAPRVAAGVRLCPDCRKRELEPRKQRCYVCAEKAAKASAEARLEKYRKGGLHATDLPKSDVAVQ